MNRRCRCDAIEVLKASTILEEMKLVAEQGWHDVEVESDSSVVINQIRGDTSFWGLRALLMNIVTLPNRIDRIEWKAIPRAVNECAD